jgi:Trm5-related predicted tRNA methylase
MFRQPLPTIWLLLPESGTCFTPTSVVTDGKEKDRVVAVDTQAVAAKEEEEDEVEDIFMIGLFD